MNVLMTADAVGGVWTYALDLARALAPRGARVTLAVMGPPPTPEQRAEAARVPRLELREAPFRLEWMQEAWDDVARAGDWLLALERDARPDVVHLNGYAHAALSWRAPVVVVAHSCVYGWWEAVHGGAPPADGWRRYGEAVARGLLAADLVVAPTAAMLASLERHYGTRGGRALVVHNGRDAGGLRPASRKEPLALAVGRAWDPAKGVETLDAAAHASPWPIHVLGDARHPETGETRRFSGVRAEGRVGAEDLARWYGRASVYVSAARYEPFGLGALEAAHAGCALLLPDLASLREVWGDAARFVSPRDAAAFAAALGALATNEEERRRLAVAARERAARYTPEAMAAQYVDLYRSLSSDKETPPCAS